MISRAEILNAEVRALNWKQPYAELMKHGKQETRTWGTGYRGLVLICASVVPFADTELGTIAGPEQYARIITTLGVKWFNQVKRGAAVSIARLVEVHPAARWIDRPKDFETATFVKYNTGLFVHVYKDVTPIQPFVWRGSQGWRTLTEDQKKMIIPARE